MSYTQKELIEIEENFQMIAHTMRHLGANKEVSQFVIAQSLLETGHYKSNIYKENNNLFGMKLAKTRLTAANEENRKHAKYINKSASVIDYTYWLIYKGFTQKHMKDLNLFKSRLANSNYSETKDYIERIMTIYNKIEMSYDNEERTTRYDHTSQQTSEMV